MQLIKHRSGGVDIGSELCEKLAELESRVRELESREYKLIERIDALQHNGLAPATARGSVEQALDNPERKAGPILVALSVEMGGSPAERSIREALKLAVHTEAGRAYAVSIGVLGPEESPTTSYTFARYAAEARPGANRWGAPLTRRVHSMLDAAGFNPSGPR